MKMFSVEDLEEIAAAINRCAVVDSGILLSIIDMAKLAAQATPVTMTLDSTPRYSYDGREFEVMSILVHNHEVVAAGYFTDMIPHIKIRLFPIADLRMLNHEG